MERTILVVDDEQRLAESLAALLRDEGYDVDAAVGGKMGLEKLAEKKYRLVITDLRMPEVDGFQIMDAISRNHPDTAIIVITGHASTQSAIEAIHQRVADYVTKPFELDFLIASIEKVFAQIETAELRQDMMRMIGHDIKVPLNSIMGFAQFIIDKKTGLPSDRAGEYADKILLNSQRILSMLDNYLTQARAVAGKLDIIARPLALQDTIEEAARMMAAEFTRRCIVLEMEIDPSIEHYPADEHLIFRAVANLLNNAAKYTPEGGSAWCRLRKESRPNIGPAVVIEIENTGPGIAAFEIPHVFDKYHRTASSQGTEGSGLGLFVVQQVAKAHRGWAECRSIEGELTTFRIVLPIHRDEERPNDTNA